MTIDVSEEIQKWIKSRDYIFFNNQHFAETGDLSASTVWFENKFNATKGKLKSQAMASQISAIQSSLQQQGYGAADVLNIVGGLQNGNLMETTMVQIGQTLDNIVQDFYSKGGQDIESYLKAIQTSKSNYTGLFANGPANSATLNNFFNFILSGLNLIGQIDTEILDAFTNIGQKLSENGKSFIFKPNAGIQKVKGASKEDLNRSKAIMQQLDKAAGILRQKGAVSQQSFSGTLNNIFSKTIGEALAKTIIESSIAQADEMIMNEFLSKANVTLNPNSSFKLIGDELTVDKVTSKVDILNNAGFQMSVTAAGNQNYNISLMSNFSVKTYSKDNANIKIVDKTPFGKMYQMGNDEGYWAYNIMAHRKSGSGFTNAYEQLRASTSASFLEGWLSGSGSQYSNIQGIDKIQFLMVNGRIYSVAEVISRICDNLMGNTGAKYKAVNMSIEGRDSSINKWQGSAANAQMAKIRSDATREVINTLTISAHLNSNILKTIIP